MKKNLTIFLTIVLLLAIQTYADTAAEKDKCVQKCTGWGYIGGKCMGTTATYACGASGKCNEYKKYEELNGGESVDGSGANKCGVLDVGGGITDVCAFAPDTGAFFCYKEIDCTANGADCTSKCGSNCGAECVGKTKCEDYTDKATCTGNACKFGDKSTSACKWDDTTKCTANSVTTPTTGGGGDTGSDVIAKIKEAVKNLACTIYAIIYYTATGFVALVLLLSGVKWMTSDDTGGRIEARRRLSYAIVGLIVIILACPLINFFFAGTDLVKKGPCDCGNLPFTGGGPGPTPNGVCSADEKTIGVPNSVRCDVSTDCATYDNSGCKHYCGGRHICFGKKNVGEDCDPKELYDVNEQNTKRGLMCMSNECSNGKCQNNPSCTSSATVSSSEYCGSDNYPKDKKKGEGDSCGASEITSPDNPDLICASNWCTSAGCRPYGQCWTALDCESSFHYGSSRFCNPSINPWSCEIKRGTGKACKAGDEVNRNANKVCQSNSCLNDKCT